MTHNELLRSFFAANKDNHRLESELKAALVERDEARREVCEGCVQQRHPPMQHAIDRGWDCFKKETP